MLVTGDLYLTDFSSLDSSNEENFTKLTDEVLEMLNSLYAHLQTVPESGTSKPNMTRKDVLDFAVNNQKIFLIQRASGSVQGTQLHTLGFVSVTPSDWDKNMLCITNMYLKPNERGRGLAAKVFNLLVQYAKDLGLKSLGLNVAIANTPAVTAYDKYGFKPTSQFMKKCTPGD
jgi:predicted GNAT family acetyltransferase